MLGTRLASLAMRQSTNEQGLWLSPDSWQGAWSSCLVRGSTGVKSSRLIRQRWWRLILGLKNSVMYAQYSIPAECSQIRGPCPYLMQTANVSEKSVCTKTAELHTTPASLLLRLKRLDR